MRKNLHHKIMLSILAGSLALGFIYALPAFAEEDVTIADGGTYNLDADYDKDGTNYGDASNYTPITDFPEETITIGTFTVTAGNGGSPAVASGNVATGGDGGDVTLTFKNDVNGNIDAAAGNSGNSYYYSDSDNATGGNGGNVTLIFEKTVTGNITATGGDSGSIGNYSTEANLTGVNGGKVTLTFDNVVKGNITAKAGSGNSTHNESNAEATGGAGGNVTLTFKNVNGNITAEAGNGGDIDNYSINGNATGGNGGDVTLTFNDVVNGNITAAAGKGGNIDHYGSNGNTTGGAGGNVTLTFTNVVNGNITAAAGDGGYFYGYISSGNITGGNGGDATLTFKNVVTNSIKLTSGINGNNNRVTAIKGGNVTFEADTISGITNTDSRGSTTTGDIAINITKNDGDITFDVGTLNIADNTVKITATGDINTGIEEGTTQKRKANHIDNLILTGNGDFKTVDENGDKINDITVGSLTINDGTVNDNNWAGFIDRTYYNDYGVTENNNIALGENGVTFDITSDKKLSKNLTGSSTGNLTKTGTGTLKLTGSIYNYTGLTVVEKGTLDASASELTNSKGLTLLGDTTFVANTTQDWNGKQIAVYDNGSDTSATYQGNLNAQNSNLYFIASGDNTNSLLKVINNGTDNNGNVNIAGSNYNLGLTGDKILDIGSKLTLIEADGTINADNLEPGSGIKVGSTIKQDITTNVEVSVDDSGSKEKLIATVSGALATDEASAINTGMLGGLAFNLQGADLIAREGMEAAIRSAHLDNNHAVFAALTRSSLDYGAVDVDGTNMLAGLAWRSTTGAGSMTYGVFAEHGDGSYDTYANINGTSLHGEGDTAYTGGGILARMDFNGSENGHGYLEASGRVANADTDYTNSGLRNAYGRAASYSTDGTYYGAHIGAGYVQKLDEKSSIDWYGKLLWARLEGGSADLSTGEHLTFDDADSLRLRIGGRWNYTASDFVNYYAGLGYEYEFDGEASGFTNGLALGDEDLTGGSGVAELGISFKPSKNSPFSLELNLAGFTGEREGFRGGVEAVYTF